MVDGNRKLLQKISPREIIIGSRSSKLAIIQALEVKQEIINSYTQYQENPDLIIIKTFQTSGDKIKNKSLVEIGGKGLFIKEIEEALLNNQIDIAAHSMKDMPAFFTENLEIFATLKREDARDCFISNKYSNINNLPKNSTLGTSSPRRAALILHNRPDLNIVNFRGNVNTRLNKLKNDHIDATILAVAGLRRMEMEDSITSIIDENQMLPAIGQGALALQAKKDNHFIAKILSKINHKDSKICIDAERAFQKSINGSCKTPLAANCQIINNQLHLKALLASLDGKEILFTTRIGNLNEAEEIGNDAGIEIKFRGKHILDNL